MCYICRNQNSQMWVVLVSGMTSRTDSMSEFSRKIKTQEKSFEPLNEEGQDGIRYLRFVLFLSPCSPCPAAAPFR